MNRHLVFGTAGHVDHGKTSFIKSLTGMDTDRLEMEKERGITIENGYAHLTLSSGATVGFIDVPGHEKFIKTMLAGAMGMDAVILIIAADEGIKPQTLEHLNIIKHLNVKKGFVLITKTDLSDDLSINKLKCDIVELVKGSVFESSPILSYSIMHPECKSAVVLEIEQIANANYERSKHASSRLHVDRVFTRKGFGTVVTGTLIEGEIKTGETLYAYPGDNVCRVKGIHVYGHPSTVVYYGQRAALNLSVPLDAIKKGDVLSSQSTFKPTMIIDIAFKADTQVTHWQRLKLYHGTREVLCRIVLPGGKSIEANTQINVQLRLESPIYCKNNDKVVLRNYSPTQTIGGGKVLNAYAKKKKSAMHIKDTAIEMNEIIETLKLSTIVFEYTSNTFAGTSLSILRARDLFNDLLEQELVLKLEDPYMILTSQYSKIKTIALNEVRLYHQTYPLRVGIPRETLRSKISKQINYTLSAKEFTFVLKQLISDLEWVEKGDFIALNTFKHSYSKQEKQLMDSILNQVKCHPQHLVAFAELEKSSFNKILIKEMLNHLINYEFLVKINDEYVIDVKEYLSCKEQLIHYLSKHDYIEVASYRDLLGFSRKSTVTLLEHFDKIQLTQRIDNKRIINKL